ncbi:MAG: DUF523 domain-containing protein [Elusimicrobiaceae bacterium]|jgi:uncharacterized protein YbbK (DUF523 family)
MPRENILVSACLCGIKCRYDGSAFYCKGIEKLLKKYTVIPFCPELLAGQSIPRPPVEIVKGKAQTCSGEEQTRQFKLGAKISLTLAKRFDVKKAFLKSGSPSCGCETIYDGTFSGKLIKGRGFTAGLFAKNGVKTFSERHMLGERGI